MTVNAGAEATSGGGPNTSDEQVGSDTRDKSQFKEKLRELGLKGTYAYVPIERRENKVSEAAESKRKYREQQKAKGLGQYPVEVPYDEDARYAVYAVAKAIVADKENTKGVRSTVLAFVSSAALLELVQLISASEVDISSIIEVIKRDDLAKIAAIHAARPTLVDDVSRLAKSNDRFLSVVDCLVHHAGDISGGSAEGLLEAAVAASGCREALKYVEVRRRGGLRARLLGWVLGGMR